MGLFKRKSEKEKLSIAYMKKLEQAKRISTVNRSESDRLTKEADDILNKIKDLEGEA